MGDRPMSVAFNGALFAWPYQAGAAAYVQDRDLLAPSSRVYGTSSGSIVGVMLACGVDIARIGLDAGMSANSHATAGRRNPFFRSANVIATYFEIFGRALPDDAHVRASGRLFVRVTRLRTLERILVSEFASRQALLDALAASIAIPGITVPLARRLEPHGWCLDGGPTTPDDDRPGVHTVRVGVGPRLPGARPEHISPSRPVSLDQRLLVLPPARRRELYDLGYADARRHLEAA